MTNTRVGRRQFVYGVHLFSFFFFSYLCFIVDKAHIINQKKKAKAKAKEELQPKHN
jgi:hypothetical protein